MGQPTGSPTPRGSGSVHSVPSSPQDVEGSFRSAAGPRALTFGFVFSPPPAATSLGPLFGPLRAQGPIGPGCPAFPARLHQFSAVPTRGPIPAARPRRESQSSPHTTTGPPYHPILGLLLSGSRPLTNPGLTSLPGPALKPRGPKAWPRPLAHFKGPVTNENAAPEAARSVLRAGLVGSPAGVTPEGKPRSSHMRALSLAFPLTFPSRDPLERDPARLLEG